MTFIDNLGASKLLASINLFKHIANIAHNAFRKVNITPDPFPRKVLTTKAIHWIALRIHP